MGQVQLATQTEEKKRVRNKNIFLDTMITCDCNFGKLASGRHYDIKEIG
jgi:hypothetical protein